MPDRTAQESEERSGIKDAQSVPGTKKQRQKERGENRWNLIWVRSEKDYRRM